MKKSLNKTTALILAAILLAMPFVSCSETADDETESESKSSASESVSDASSDETEETGTHYYNEMAAVDYGGWILSIASRPLSGDNFNVITVEDLTGDVFNDAVYNREHAVEDKFNVEIEEHYVDDVTKSIRTSVMGGLEDYNLAIRDIWDIGSLIMADCVYPVNEMPVIDLDMPWWDQGAIDELTINDMLYFAFCDISFDHYEQSVLLYYNGQLLTDNGITESPYNLYTEEKWTLDAMYDMMKIVSRDLNGDGSMNDEDDLFGFVGRHYEYIPPVAAAGYRLVTFDEELQEAQFNVTNEDIMKIGEKLNVMLFDKSIALPADRESNMAMFKESRTLFLNGYLGFYRSLRDKEDDYGIINWPTLYENENENAKMYVYDPATLFIAAICSDPERLGTVMEGINAYTYDNVLDDYINKAVIGKGARDKESAQVIRDFIPKRTHDVANAFGLSSAESGWKMAVGKNIYGSIAARSSASVAREMRSFISGME